MIQAIIEEIKERKGWEKVALRTKIVYYDFKAGKLIGAKETGDWHAIEKDLGIDIIFKFRTTYMDTLGNLYAQRIEVVGDESHTYFPVLNTNIIDLTFSESEKIIISESPFRVRVPSDITQYDRAVEELRTFQIHILTINPIG